MTPVADVAPELPPVLAEFVAQHEAARTNPDVRFPMRTPEVIAAEAEYGRAYRDAVRAAARQGRTIGPRRDRPRAVQAAQGRASQRCGICGTLHPGEC